MNNDKIDRAKAKSPPIFSCYYGFIHRSKVRLSRVQCSISLVNRHFDPIRHPVFLPSREAHVLCFGMSPRDTADVSYIFMSPSTSVSFLSSFFFCFFKDVSHQWHDVEICMYISELEISLMSEKVAASSVAIMIIDSDGERLREFTNASTEREAIAHSMLIHISFPSFLFRIRKTTLRETEDSSSCGRVE